MEWALIVSLQIEINIQRMGGNAKQCFNCGGRYPHVKDRPCPALGKKCKRCGKENHFEKCCRSERLNSNVSSDPNSESKNDVIESVDGPTPWVSPIVPIVKNSGEIRICTVAKLLNTAIMREIHHTPTIEE
jgi:hypothetical protein